MNRLPKRKRLSPQDKKKLALKKDRREDFGENDKAARRLVPLRKAQLRRRLRRTDRQALAKGEEPPAPRPGGDAFRKWPGRTLGRDIEIKLDDRAWLERTAGRAPVGRTRLRAHERARIEREDQEK